MEQRSQISSDGDDYISVRKASVASISSVRSCSHEFEVNPFESSFATFLDVSTTGMAGVSARPMRPFSLDGHAMASAASGISRNSSINSGRSSCLSAEPPVYSTRCPPGHSIVR